MAGVAPLSGSTVMEVADTAMMSPLSRSTVRYPPALVGTTNWPCTELPRILRIRPSVRLVARVVMGPPSVEPPEAGPAPAEEKEGGSVEVGADGGDAAVAAGDDEAELSAYAMAPTPPVLTQTTRAVRPTCLVPTFFTTFLIELATRRISLIPSHSSERGLS